MQNKWVACRLPLLFAIAITWAVSTSGATAQQQFAQASTAPVDCRFLSGADRSACNHAEAAARSAKNKQAADAHRAQARDQSADRTPPEAVSVSAPRFETGGVDPSNNRKVAATLSFACNGGDGHACFGSGKAYLADARLAFAARDFGKGCNFNDRDSCFNYAVMWEAGQGLNKSVPYARNYYKKACDLGDAEGCKRSKAIDDARPRNSPCVEGYKAYRINYDKQTFKVVCVVSTGTLTSEEREIPATEKDLAYMKSDWLKKETLSHPIDVVGDTGRGRSQDCTHNDMRGADGAPITGSGCIGR
jgi:hypothetical protein